MDAEMVYNQGLDYLYSFVDYSLKKSSELAQADFNLDRMHELLARLGDPHRRYPVLHVAGTKGKGSTAALCASALRSAGFRTGLYTSPHLQDYTERIQVDGRPLPHAGLVGLIEQVRPHVAAVPKLTTFEITTAIGFLYFAQQKVAAAVIEVGLGGRLDATNVVDPVVAVITSLSYDHMAVLGNTLTLIAHEKAGIIKAGVPVVSSPQVEEARLVIEQVAAERKAPLTLIGREWTFAAGERSLDGQSLTITDPLAALPNSVILRIPLLGRHQLVNTATAWAALHSSGLAVPEPAIRAGFTAVVWPCRFEVVRRPVLEPGSPQEPPVVLDSAHNLDSFEKLGETLDEYFPGRPVTLVFGSSEDKDIPGMLAALQPRLKRVIATRADHPRAVDQALLVGRVSREIPAEAVEPVAAALGRALALSRSDGSLVLSAGSMFVTAEVKTAWQKLVQPSQRVPRST